ncbi:MAG: hypothetical protein K2O24_03105 [Muribaculaceae bacterium]|nr:hypothetical protein [Muribaculaceae bacterium]
MKQDKKEELQSRRSFFKFKPMLATMIACIVGVSIYAQYYNPYQSAYEYGQELVRQQQEMNQKAFEMGQRMGAEARLIIEGKELIVEGDYDEALEKFNEAYEDYDSSAAAYWVGICNELGIGCERDLDWADKMYEYGARRGDVNCQMSVSRINNQGHYAASYRSKAIANLRQQYNAYIGGNGSYVPGVPANSSGNGSSTYTTCRICNGTGVCTSCHGKGGSWANTGYYTGSGNQSWITCGSCNGNKSCFNCHGTGRQ